MRYRLSPQGPLRLPFTCVSRGEKQSLKFGASAPPAHPIKGKHREGSRRASSGGPHTARVLSGQGEARCGEGPRAADGLGTAVSMGAGPCPVALPPCCPWGAGSVRQGRWCGLDPEAGSTTPRGARADEAVSRCWDRPVWEASPCSLATPGSGGRHRSPCWGAVPTLPPLGSCTPSLQQAGFLWPARQLIHIYSSWQKGLLRK